MNKKTTRVLHVLLVALVTLTGVLPVVPAASAASDQPLPLAETRRQAISLDPLATDRTASENAAPTQEPEAIDPSEWDQEYPSAAGDSAGNVYAVWEDYRDGAVPHVRFVQRPPDGDWQASVQIDSTAAGDQKEPQIAVDGSGNLYAVWEDHRGGEQQIYFAYQPAGGDWGVSEPISLTTQAQDRPSLAVNRRGEAVVSWRQEAGSDYNVFSAIRPAGGDWGAAEQRAGPDGGILNADVARDDWGRVYIAWDRGNQIFFAERSPDGPWSANEQIRDNLTGSTWGIQIAVDGAGNVHAVWEDKRSGGSEIYAAYRPASGPWSVNVRLDDGDGGMWSPGLGIDGAGNAVAAWSEANENVYGAVRYLGSGWTPSKLLAATPASSTTRLADERTMSPSGPHAIQSWLPALAVVGPAGTLLWVGASMVGDLNILAQDLSSPGSNGCGNGADSCRAGNGGQEPPFNGDQGFIGPPGPPPQMGGYTIQPVEVDGQTVYVVRTGSGADGIYSDLGDAERFGQEHATPPLPALTFDPSDLPDLPPTPLPDPFSTPGDIFPNQEDFFLGDLFQPTPADLPPTSDTPQKPPPDMVPIPGDIFPNQEDFLLGDLFQPTPTNLPPTPDIPQTTPTDLPPTPDIPPTPSIPIPPVQPPQPQPQLTDLPGDQGESPEARLRAAVEEHERLVEEHGRLVDERIEQERRRQQDILERMDQPDISYSSYSPIMSRIGEVDVLGSPVLPHSGEYGDEQTLLRIPGRGLDYALRLSYHSQLVYDGPLGWGWEHDYDRRFVSADGGSLALQEGAGRFDVYSFDGADFTPPAGRYTTLVSATTGITLTGRSGGVEGYYPLNDATAPGQLRSTADRYGNTLRFAYDGNGRLQTVTDTLGREITYTYDGNDRISSVTDFSGRSVTLAYDVNGDLVSITTPAVTDFLDGKTTVFSYTSGFDDERLNHNLTTIIAPNQVADGSLTPRTVNTYGTEGFAFDRLVNQSWGGGRANASGVPAGGDVTLVYTTAITAEAPAGAASKVTITDRGDNVIEIWHDGAGHRLRDRQTAAGQVLVTDHTYNADGQMTSVTYPAGSRIEYTYDDGAADRLAQGNLLEEHRVPDATRGCDGAGGAGCPDLVTTYTYEPRYQLLQTSTGARGYTVTRTHDTQGNLVQVTFPTVTVGPAAPQAAVENWTYNSWGQPLTFTDTEGNVTQYEYYASGYRQRITRDSGGLDVSTEYAYDSVGHVTAITDSLGVRTEYVFNDLDQVVKKTRAAGTALDYETLYWYDGNDNLVQRDVENVVPDLDGDFHPTGTHSLDAANPWLTTAYTYDLLDNVVTQTVEISATAQVTTGYRYDRLENLVSITDPEGNRLEYAYDERSLLRETTWGAGSSEAITTTYEYDGNGNLVQTADGEGNLTDYVYDGFDRRVGRVDAPGNVRTWEYDANGNVVATLLRDGQDDRNPGRVLTGTAPVTLTHALNRYDERGRRYWQERAFFTADVGTGAITPLMTDGNGDGWVETAYTYDRNGNLTAVTGDDGNITRYTYDGLDRLVLNTDALSNSVAYAYDGNGNLVQTVATERQPDGLAPDETFTTTSAYDSVNRLVQATDNLSQTARYAYDSRGNLVFTSDGNGPLTGARSSDFSRSTTKVVTTNASNDHGNTSLFAYDGLNGPVGYGVRSSDFSRLTTSVVTTNASNDHGNTSLFAYDGLNGPVGYGVRSSDFSRLTTSVVTTNASNDHGNTALFAYDGLNRRLAETYHLRAGGVGSGAVTGQVTMTYAYDGNGNLVRSSDPNGNETIYGYDGLDRLAVVTRTDGTTATLAYDQANNLVQQTDANGSLVAHTYDALNRLVRSDVTRAENVGGTTVQIFAWDGLSRQVAATDDNDPANPADDSALEFTYDSLSNRRSEVQGSHTVSSTYDGLGNRLSLAYPGGTVLTYTHDELNRVETIAAAGGAIATYDYIGSSRLLRRTNGNGTYAAYAYDGARRLTEITHRLSSDASLLTGFSYTYDRVGNRLTEIAQPGDPTTYTYDSLYRLTGAQGADYSVQYIYDAAGNRVEVMRDGQATSYTTNEMHEYESVDGESRTYDANGNLLSRRVVVECIALDEVSIGGPPTTTVGTATTFTATASPPTATLPITYTWQAEVGQVANLSYVTHTGGISDTVTFTWGVTGTKMVTVTAVNECGVAFSGVHTITVEAAPPPPPCNELSDVVLDGPPTTTVNVATTFTATASPPTATLPITYTWQAEVGQVANLSYVTHTGGISDTVTFTWGVTGTKMVTVTAVNECGVAFSGVHTITVEAAPPPPPCNKLSDVALDGPPTTTVNVATTFTAAVSPPTATLPITYTWQAEVGQVANLSYVTHTGGLSDTVAFTWNVTGTKMVTVTAVNECGVAFSGVHTITVEAAPPPPPCNELSDVVLDGPPTTTVNVATTFTAAVSPPTATLPITYTWQAEVGQVANLSYVTHTGGISDTVAFTWAVTGTKTVTVTAVNECGVAFSGVHTITVEAEKWSVYLPLVLSSVEGLALKNRAPALNETAVVTETVTRYEYDFADRLLGLTEWVTVTAGVDVQVVSATVRFTHDALGRQVGQQTESGSVRYLYAGGRVIEERDEADALLATYAGRLTMERGGSRFFYQADGLGSVRALADDTGSVVERVDYAPFGSPVFSGGGDESALGNPYLFRGRRYDVESGFYGSGGRRYDPDTGRHVQRGSETLGNPYTFAGNNPAGGIPR